MSKQVKVYSSAEMDEIYGSISPEEQERTDNRMLLAAKIDDGLKAKGWKKKDFMLAMEQKNQSVISKWLSGTHNFTMDTLTDIGRVLGINLLNLEKEIVTKNVVYHFYAQQNKVESSFEQIMSQPDSTRHTSKVSLLKSNHYNNLERAKA